MLVSGNSLSCHIKGEGLALNAIRCASPLPLAALVSAFAAIGVAGEGLAAQAHSTVVIPDDPEPPYEIEMHPGPLFEGGSLTEDDWVSAFVSMERSGDGGFLFWDGVTPSRILAVSPDRAIRRWIGREGEGPGEYRSVRWVRSRGGRAHVFDTFNNRRTVLDERSFEVLHTNPHDLPIAAGYDATVLDDTSYVINAAFHVPERVGYALHRFGPDGAAANSFDEEPVGLPGEEEPLARWLAPSSQAGHFWAGPFDEYRVDMWDAVEGRRSRSLVREADWFPPRAAPWDPTAWEPGMPGITVIDGAAEDAAGRLWVVLRIPTSLSWPADCFERIPDPAPGEFEYAVREACQPLTRNRIEVLDPGTGRLLFGVGCPARKPGRLEDRARRHDLLDEIR